MKSLFGCSYKSSGSARKSKAAMPKEVTCSLHVLSRLLAGQSLRQECVLLATQSSAAFLAVAAHSAGLHTDAATARPVMWWGNSGSFSTAQVIIDLLKQKSIPRAKLSRRKTPWDSLRYNGRPLQQYARLETTSQISPTTQQDATVMEDITAS